MLYYAYSLTSFFMQKFLPLFCVTLLTLIGAGCSKAPAPAAPTDLATREQQAYVFCTNKKATPQIRFDSEANRNRLYCEFAEGKECDAIAYMDGKCDPAKLTVETNINESLTPPGQRFNCSPIAKPVCTTGNKTYTNRCIAESQGQTVKYEGVCSEKEEPFVLDSSNQVDSGTTVTKRPYEKRTATWPASSGSSSRTVTNNPAPAPVVTSAPAPTQNEPVTSEWVDSLTALLQSSASPYAITLSQCHEGSNTYYYQKEDCSTCFKILYSNSGQSLCYPGMNDDACPKWSERNCRVVWTK